MELYGTQGSLFLPDPNFFGGVLERAGCDGVITQVADWEHPLGVPNENIDGPNPHANYRTAGLADMAMAILQDRPHRCSQELALHAVDVMTSILKSGESGGFVEITTTCESPAALSPDQAQQLLV